MQYSWRCITASHGLHIKVWSRYSSLCSQYSAVPERNQPFCQNQSLFSLILSEKGVAEIHLSNEEQVILKIAPLKDMRVMTYEKNIMFSEVEAIKLVIRNGEVPVPQIIYYYLDK